VVSRLKPVPRLQNVKLYCGCYKAPDFSKRHTSRRAVSGTYFYVNALAAKKRDQQSSLSLIGNTEKVRIVSYIQWRSYTRCLSGKHVIILVYAFGIGIISSEKAKHALDTNWLPSVLSHSVESSGL